ncbi:uncharacterized protein LOC129964086 isoform X2 [Argiope bruennichi]|uniref:Uncharacterized protein n=2 Tax=Argiope bruennichi TaxID=94029 RepID=A0A8T0EWZ6_ARGBR|nr:uncharacterized protein LOC129964086 isoform X2 [Argiope bruennichi]KAF8782875.1 hypothetical protein HNY73_013109 [Argiope bruennichi]
MSKLLFSTLLLLFVAGSVLCCETQCDNISCDDIYCPSFLTPLVIGCNCCPTCVNVIKPGHYCFNPPFPMPIAPPPFPEKCYDGYYCDKWTQTCQRSKVA